MLGISIFGATVPNQNGVRGNYSAEAVAVRRENALLKEDVVQRLDETSKGMILLQTRQGKNIWVKREIATALGV